MAPPDSTTPAPPQSGLGACCLSLVLAGAFAADHTPIPLSAGIDFLYCSIALVLTLAALGMALISLRRLRDRELIWAGILIIFCAAMLYYMFGYPVEQLEELSSEERLARLTVDQLTRISMVGKVVQNLIAFGIAAVGANVTAHGLMQINSRRKD